MRVRDLKQWPRKASGAYRGWHLVPPPEHAMVKTVVHVQNNWIIFSCEFGGELYAFDFEAPDDVTLGRVKAILEENAGKSLSAIGELELAEG
jgi:hypothetical protein